MLSAVNKLADCYLVSAFRLGLQCAQISSSDRTSFNTPVNDAPTKAILGIAQRALLRMGWPITYQTVGDSRREFYTLDLSKKPDSSLQSGNAPDIALKIFDLDARFLDASEPLPEYLTELLSTANNNWGGLDESHQTLFDSALLAPLLLIIHQRCGATEEHTVLAGTALAKVGKTEVLAEELLKFLTRLGIVETEDSQVRWSAKGQFLIDRAMLNGIVISYAPLLKQVISVLRRETGPSFDPLKERETTRNSLEIHIDRRLNVNSSGFQHRRYFHDLVETIQNAFQNLSPQELPELVADMGCGDASLLRQLLTSLRHLYHCNSEPILVAADLNRAALNVASENLKGTRHLLIEADIRDPGSFVQSIRATTKTTLGSDKFRDRILHIRSFLDHDRAHDEPLNVEAADQWLGLSLSGQYLRRSGEALPAHHAFQALVEHMERWSQIVGKQGLLLLEVHLKRTDDTWLDDHHTNSIHFEAIHSLSGQQLFEADNFILAAAAAGLFTDSKRLRQYPQHESFTQISLHWFRAFPAKLRLATGEDLPELMELERACWGDLAIDEKELLRRIIAKPSGVFVLTHPTNGRILASLATQRIASTACLSHSSVSELSSLADSEGRVLQILTLNVQPEYQEQGLGELLINFAICYARLSDQIDSMVGVTRCRDANVGNAAEYEQYVLSRNSDNKPIDPILRFHHENGATIGSLISDFRPNDQSNYGYGVLVHYSVKPRASSAGPPNDNADSLSTPNSRSTVLRGSEDPVRQLNAVDVSSQVRQILKSKKIEEYDSERPLLELGLDSLDIQELRANLVALTGKELLADFFFSHPTPAKIQAALTTGRSLTPADEIVVVQSNETQPNETQSEHGIRSELLFREDGRKASLRGDGASQQNMQHDQKSTLISEPIAIIGMGCRFPGKVESASEYWNLLYSGRSGITEVPASRWDVDKMYDIDPDAPGKMWTRQGGFLDEIDQFDAAFFGISRREARRLDPQQRLLLETTWRAFEDAGLVPSRLAGSKTGVFVGIGFNDYAGYLFSDHNSIDAYCATGTFQSTASGRLAYFYDLRGPCLSIDTACSSSLAALHLAVQSLRQGESNMAIVAGVNFISPEVTINFTKARMLSPDGSCRTFDKSANGYVRGEGCGAVILKRLSDAQRDGDNIQAVIRATGCNQDGRSNGLTAPNGLAQQQLLVEMLANAQIPPESIAYAEAHGTATPLGDPIEANALIEGLRRQANDPLVPLLMGSVKTNLGHLEAAAGMASLIKVVLSLKHRKIPPHLNFSQWNPEINRSGLKIDIPLKTVDFPDFQLPSRVTVSSFGFGGTNAMAIVEEYVEPETVHSSDQALHRSGGNSSHIICLSAKTSGSLKRTIQRWLNFLPNSPNTIQQMAIGSQLRRQHFPVRKAIVVSSVEEAIDSLMDLQVDDASQPDNQHRPVAMLFTGQGSQYPDMGRAIYDEHPVFRQQIEDCFDCFKGLLPNSLRDVMFTRDPSDRRIHETLYTQPALFALEISLAKMWQRFGVEPNLCFGHSIGEFAAATVAGVLELEDAVSIVAERARLIDSLPRTGGMSACYADESTIAPLLERFQGQLSIAAVNSPNNTVVSGETAALERVENELRQQGIVWQRLTVSHAFHSSLIEPIAKSFEEFCTQFEFNTPRIPMISNVSSRFFDDSNRFDAKYLVRQLLGTVRFSDSVSQASDFGTRIFLEIGPDATLSSLGKRTIPGGKSAWLSSLKPGNETQRLRLSLASLYENGATIDWTEVNHGMPRPLVSLPGYEFERQSYWFTSYEAELTGHRSRGLSQPLSSSSNGKMTIGNSSPSEMLEWHLTPDGDLHLQIELNPKFDSGSLLASLLEHRIRERPLFPAAGYLSVVVQAAEKLLPMARQGLDQHAIQSNASLHWRLGQAKLLKPLPLDPDNPVTLHVSFRNIETHTNLSNGDLGNNTTATVGWKVAAYFRHSTVPDGQWIRSFSASLELIFDSGRNKEQIDERLSDSESQVGQDYYASLEKQGYHYGKSYQLLEQLTSNGRRSQYLVTSPNGITHHDESPMARFARETVLFDALAHGTLALRPQVESSSIWLPIGWDKFQWQVDPEVKGSHQWGGTWDCNASTVNKSAREFGCSVLARSGTAKFFDWSGLSFQLLKGDSTVDRKSQSVPEGGTSRKHDSRPNDSSKTSELLDILCKKLAHILMLEDGEQVSPHANFTDLGLDSIMVTELEMSWFTGNWNLAKVELAN